MNTLAEQWRNEGIEIGEKIGEKIGERRGEKRGRLEYARKILFVVATERLDILPQRLAEEINRVESTEILDELIRKTLRCESVEQFEGWIEKALGGEDAKT